MLVASCRWLGWLSLLVTLLDVMLDHMYCICRQRKQGQREKMAKQTAKSRNGLQSARDGYKYSESMNTAERLPSLSSSPRDIRI